MRSDWLFQWASLKKLPELVVQATRSSALLLISQQHLPHSFRCLAGTVLARLPWAAGLLSFNQDVAKLFALPSVATPKVHINSIEGGGPGGLLCYWESQTRLSIARAGYSSCLMLQEYVRVYNRPGCLQLGVKAYIEQVQEVLDKP